MARVAGLLESEPQAEQLYHPQLRSQLCSRYAQWDREVDRLIDARLEATG